MTQYWSKDGANTGGTCCHTKPNGECQEGGRGRSALHSSRAAPVFCLGLFDKLKKVQAALSLRIDSVLVWHKLKKLDS